MAADRETAALLLDQAERCRAEATRQPLGPAAPKLRLQADFLMASARRLLRQLHQAETEAVQS